MPRLVSGAAHALIDTANGGRVSSLVVQGTGLVVGPGDGHSAEPGALDWGIYPMVPFAGRVRNGRFAFAGSEHELVRRRPPHAIHGTVDDAEWEVQGQTGSTVALTCALGPRWPFAGRVTHSISLLPDRLRMVLSLHADESMPAQVGWHPWFRRPASVLSQFREWQPRDAEGMPGPPTAAGVPVPVERVDDCFVADGAPVRIRTCGVGLSLRSDCSHWVVFDGADHGVCVEPQSGPPNEFESAPFVLAAGATLDRWFEIAWDPV